MLKYVRRSDTVIGGPSGSSMQIVPGVVARRASFPTAPRSTRRAQWRPPPAGGRNSSGTCRRRDPWPGISTEATRSGRRSKPAIDVRERRRTSGRTVRRPRRARATARSATTTSSCPRPKGRITDHATALCLERVVRLQPRATNGRRRPEQHGRRDRDRRCESEDRASRAPGRETPCSSCVDNCRTSSRLPQCASSRPSNAPALDRSRLSVRSCRAIRSRDAPSAMRRLSS